MTTEQFRAMVILAQYAVENDLGEVRESAAYKELRKEFSIDSLWRQFKDYRKSHHDEENIVAVVNKLRSQGKYKKLAYLFLGFITDVKDKPERVMNQIKGTFKVRHVHLTDEEAEKIYRKQLEIRRI